MVRCALGQDMDGVSLGRLMLFLIPRAGAPSGPAGTLFLSLDY